MPPHKFSRSTPAAIKIIDYVATDQNGLTATSTRIVIIEPADVPSIIPMDDASTTTTASSTEATSTDQ